MYLINNQLLHFMSCYRDLNPGPLPYQGSALPLSYNSKENKSCGQRWIRTTEGVSQQIYSLPHLATLVFAPTLQKELFSLLNHRRVNFTRTISVLISSPPREERLIPLILERASCRIRTNDPEITNHVLWPTELKRQAKKCNRNVHSVSETAANLGIYFLPAKF